MNKKSKPLEELVKEKGEKIEPEDIRNNPKLNSKQKTRFPSDFTRKYQIPKIEEFLTEHPGETYKVSEICDKLDIVKWKRLVAKELSAYSTKPGNDIVCMVERTFSLYKYDPRCAEVCRNRHPKGRKNRCYLSDCKNGCPAYKEKD